MVSLPSSSVVGARMLLRFGISCYEDTVITLFLSLLTVCSLFPNLNAQFSTLYTDVRPAHVKVMSVRQCPGLESRRLWFV